MSSSNPFQLNINQSLPQPSQISQRSSMDSTFFNLNDPNLDKEGDLKANLSRHVSSVISHFTSSKDGYSRLLNELDDFIHAVTNTMGFTYVTPSCLKHLGYSQDELMDKTISEVVHQSDWIFFQNFIQNSLDNQTEFLTYCRYLTKTGSIKLFEVRGKPYVDPDPNSESPVQLILSARDYSTKSTQALDSIIDLQIERLGLRTKLEKALRQLGRDPMKNMYLTEQPDGEEFADAFLQIPRPELPDYSISDLFPNSPAPPHKPVEPEKKKVCLGIT
jgi:PAS domain S-box-containing protein